MWPSSKDHASKPSSSKPSGSSKTSIPQPSSKPSATSRTSLPPNPPSTKPSASSEMPIPQTTTPRQMTPTPPSTQPPLSQRHQQQPPLPPSIQQQQQEEQLLQSQQPRPHTPPNKKTSDGSASSKRSAGQKTPSTPAKGHAYTSSAGSGTSAGGFGRWSRRSLPSPPDSVVGNGEASTAGAKLGERRSWGAAGTGGVGAAGGAGTASEQRRSWGAGNGGGEKGFGRMASRIKAAVLGREDEDKAARKRGGGSAEGSLGGSLGGSASGSKMGSQVGSQVGSKVGSQVGSKAGSVSGAVGGGGEREGKSGSSSPTWSPTDSPVDSDGGKVKRGWSERMKRRRQRTQRWQERKEDKNAMPPGMVSQTQGGSNRPWGRRAILRRAMPEKEGEGEDKKKVGGFVTMADASPAPIRLPSYEKAAKKGEERGEKKGGEKGEEERKEGGEEEEEWEEGDEEDEWDEGSLIRLSDWWRQMLGKGKDPTWQELDMMSAFLSDLYDEETPSLEMILTTRLHKLLEALIKSVNEQGQRYEGKRYRKVARKATEVRDKWMHDLGDGLYDMRAERRKMLRAENGRLSRIHMRPVGEHSSRWVVEGHCMEEGVEFEPGMWWLNDACAERDGMLTDTRGNISVSPQAVPVVTLAFGEEMPTQKPTITRFTHSGRIDTMMLPLMRALDKRVQVLRRYTLKSRLAPEAGLRYDGFYDIVLYSLQRLSWDESVFRVVVEFERCMGQRPMETVLAVPTPSMLDDWEIYLEIKDDSVRRSIGEAWYRESVSKEREEEKDRLSWHQVRAYEDARRVDEDKRREHEEERRAEEDARRALEDEKRRAQMKKAERELQYLEEQERIEAEKAGEDEGHIVER